MANSALNRSVVLLLTNKSGGSVAYGGTVILSSGTASSFTTTTSASQADDIVGVVIEPNGIANDAVGLVSFGGYVPKVLLTGSASLGDYLYTSSTGGQAARSGTKAAGAFGQVLETGTSPAAVIWGCPMQAGGGGGGTTIPGTFNGRLTLESGVAISTTDQTAKTTVYLTPFRGNQIALFNGATWDYFTLTEISASLAGLTADTNYDVFVYDSSGLTLELVAWTDATTRATAITLQDGVYCKSGTLTKRYVGTIRITGSTGQCEDSLAKRFCWNYHNRVLRHQFVQKGTTWTYATASWRYGNNDSTNICAFVRGVDEDPIRSSYEVTVAPASGAESMIAVGLDDTTPETQSISYDSVTTGRRSRANYVAQVSAGYHFVSALEFAITNTTTFYANYVTGNYNIRGGLFNEVWG